MHLPLHPDLANDRDAQRARDIISDCVHCGFCTATCPTYQEVGDERDSPRGRIYLIKQMFTDNHATQVTQHHLDRCLTCRSCETTCPSGVEYGALVEIGRRKVNQLVARPATDRAMRFGLKKVLPNAAVFGVLTQVGRAAKPLVPGKLKNKIPAKPARRAWPMAEVGVGNASQPPRTMLALAGCAQPSATPNTLSATHALLAGLGISLREISKAGCCGAVNAHMDAADRARDEMRQNIDAWWPAIEAGAEAIVMTASACGLMVKEYGHYLADDPEYAEKAAKVSELAKDISQVLAAEDLASLPGHPDNPTGKAASGASDNGSRASVSLHCPCTLQHGQPDGQSLAPLVEQLLSGAGIALNPVKESHLCCGSAGTYSILQPELSNQLRERKLKHLSAGNPDEIVTANIGCQLHLGEKANVPVRHWIELLADQLLLPETR